MKKLFLLFVVAASMFIGCTSGVKSAEQTSDEESHSLDNYVVQTILSRRSIRNYTDEPIPRDVMEVILKCGINAPSGANRQPWAIRVLDNKEIISGMTADFIKQRGDSSLLNNPSFKNMFRNASTVVFVALTPDGGSGLDCGIMGENMVLAAWSMGVGSCWLGGPMGFFSTEEGKPWLERLDFPEGASLQYAIAFGYPAEAPDAKPRDSSKIKYIN